MENDVRDSSELNLRRRMAKIDRLTRKELMETLSQQPVDRNFETLLPEEADGLKRFVDVYATFLSQYGVDALTLARLQHDEALSQKAPLVRIAAYKTRKQNGNGQKGGDTR